MTQARASSREGNKKGRSRAAGVLAAFLLTVVAPGLAACGGSSLNGTASARGSDVHAAPVKGGSLVVTFQDEPIELDPAIAWGATSTSIERLTYEGLITYVSRPGEEGTQLAPSLATEVPSAANGGLSADARTYTFHLRRGVRFAPPVDREVKAQDVKWSVERMMAEPLAPATFFYTGIVGAREFMAGKVKGIAGIQVVDDYTLKVSLGQPDSSFLMVWAMPFTSVVPREWVTKVGEAIKRKPLGTGPFVIESWTPGQAIVAKRNPNYWDAGKPYLDEIRFDLSADPGTAALRVQRGEVDVTGDAIPAADYARISDDPTWGKYVDDSPEIAFYYVFMNVLEKPWDNVKVRQAVNFALNTAKLQRLMAGQIEPLHQIYPAGMPGHDPNGQFYTYDPARARQLLAEAGFPGGFKTTIYGHDVDPFPKVIKSLQSDLAEVGIDASVSLMDEAAYWDWMVLRDSHAGIGLVNWYPDFPDPSDSIGPLYTDPVERGSNPSFWENAEVDRLYAASAHELDPAIRIAMFRQMQDIIMRGAPTAPLYQPVWNGLRGKNVGGYYYHPVWRLQFQEMWKLDGT